MSTATTPPERPTAGPAGVVLAVVLAILSVGVALAVAGHYAARVRVMALEDLRSRQRSAALDRGALLLSHTERVVARLHPLDPAWAFVPSTELPLQRQTITMPMLDEATVASIRLSGLTDGRDVAWRMSWLDPTPDANVDTGRFTDAVALQLPLTGAAAFTMGDSGEPVQILHWKALWQRDVDEHFQDVQDLHPNYWTDLYWFARGSFPFPVPDAFSDPRSHAWFVARQAGNPLADFDRNQPVEELLAEGYGSLSHQKSAVSRGRGVWADGVWTVVISRPLASEDPQDAQMGPGFPGVIAVAVWDGGAGNVGGRKHWSNWLEYEVSY